MADFSPTQGRYLSFIQAYTNRHGCPPSESEIAGAICVSPPSVNQMVKMLEKKGLILRRPGKGRSTRKAPITELRMRRKLKMVTLAQQSSTISN